MNKAVTGEPEPPVLDVDNLSVSINVLYSTILSAETPARCHIRALLQPLARPRARAPRQAHGRPWQAHPGTLRSLSQLGPGRVVERSARRRTVKWRPWAAATAGKKARHSWPPIPHRAWPQVFHRQAQRDVVDYYLSFLTLLMDRILRFLLSSTQSTTLLMHYNMRYIGYYSILRVYWSRFTSSLRCTFVPAAHLNVRHTFYLIFSICNILCF